MLSIIHRPLARIAVTLLLVISMLALARPAAAFDGQNKQEADLTEKKEAAKEASAAPASQTINISYALYNSIKTEPASATAMPANSTGKAPGGPAVSTAPMTAGEKFRYWAKTFYSPGAYGAALFSGLFNELLDNDEGKEDTVENYFADAMSRAARSMAFRITSGFFEKFAYATIFKQDPRYHRSDKRSAGGKIIYAVSRVFVTQGDRCGCDQFNISYLAGGLTASFIANSWEREENRSTSQAFRRWGTHIGLTALTNIIKEFIGGQ